MIDIAHVVLRLAHVGESRAAGALRPSPDDFDTGDVGREDLEPELDGDFAQVVAQQDRGVDACSSDRQAYAREGLPASAARGYLQHVAGLRGVGVRLGE